MHWDGLFFCLNFQCCPSPAAVETCVACHVPQFLCSIAEATRKHPKADVFINYASFRRWAGRGIVLKL